MTTAHDAFEAILSFAWAFPTMLAVQSILAGKYVRATALSVLGLQALCIMAVAWYEETVVTSD